MDTPVVVALVAASASVAGAVISMANQQRTARLMAAAAREQRAEDRAHDGERIVARFREPLLRAAYDLQSRLYNILCQRFAELYVAGGTDRERTYAVENTTFLVAQYFAWVEIIRREVQFLDLGDVERTRRLATLQDEITRTWAASDLPPLFRAFAGEQRAIGEQLVRETGTELDCIGYAAYLEQQATRQESLDLLQPIRDDVARLPQAEAGELRRLQLLQGVLIDLLDFLDPECTRLPRECRSKAPEAE